MNRSVIITSVLLLSSTFLLNSCTSTGEPKPGTATVAGGTVLGAGLGAGIGALAGGHDGAAIGALIGAAAGAGTGVAANEVNKSKTALPVAPRQKNRNYVTSPFDGSTLFVGGNTRNGTRMRDPQGRLFIIGE